MLFNEYKIMRIDKGFKVKLKLYSDLAKNIFAYAEFILFNLNLESIHRRKKN
jgi:hypothetical protein